MSDESWFNETMPKRKRRLVNRPLPPGGDDWFDREIPRLEPSRPEAVVTPEERRKYVEESPF